MISQRPAATFSLAVKKDMVEKVQETAGTAYTNSKADVDITNTSFFYGGKGGGFTSEVLGEMASGKKDDNVATYNPAKIFSALEFRLKGIMLGVTSNYYMDGFFDFNNIMYYTMVLAANKENRLENTFNFSLGGDKGHSFSGSVSCTTAES